MPTFDTPTAISVSLELGAGDVRVEASERATAVVEVRPTDPGRKGDLAAAERTRVEFAGGQLRIKAPKGWRQYGLRGGGESVDIEIALPAGSRLEAESAVASLRCTGPLDECRYTTGVGDVSVEEAGAVELRTTAGDITVERARGSAEVSTGSGTVRLGSVDGAATVKNANGDIWVGRAAGELRAKAGNGSIQIDSSRGGVEAKAANGAVRVGRAAAGGVVAESGLGAIEIGVQEGVAAWLDLKTGFGRVVNDLAASERPSPGEDSLEVRARTAYGDITVRRVASERTAVEPSAA